jgi:hypothetical protein
MPEQLATAAKTKDDDMNLARTWCPGQSIFQRLFPSDQVEQVEQDDDGKRNADQPKQDTTHEIDLLF